VVISKTVKLIRFEKGNADNQVLVKTEETQVYTCRKYRTEVPVAELYNDNETIDDIEIRVDSRKRNSSMVTCEYYNRDGIFYSDEHICYFSLPISGINSKSEVTFYKTTKNPRYFTSIYFSSNLPIEEQELKIYVPDWMKVEFKENNLAPYNIRLYKTREGG
jgi:hypothetical protein